MEFMTKTCRVCLKDLQASRIGRLSPKGFIYHADEKGQLWLGSMCPACAKIDRKKYRQKKHFAKRTCIQCNTEYTPERKNSKFCTERCGIVWHSLERTKKKHRDKDVVQVLPEGEQPIVLEIKLNKRMQRRKQKLQDISTFKKEWDKMTEGLTLEQVQDALAGYRESIEKFDYPGNISAFNESKESKEDYTQEEFASLPHFTSKEQK